MRSSTNKRALRTQEWRGGRSIKNAKEVNVFLRGASTGGPIERTERCRKAAPGATAVNTQLKGSFPSVSPRATTRLSKGPCKVLCRIEATNALSNRPCEVFASVLGPID